MADPVSLSRCLCGGLMAEWPKRFRFWKELWRFACEPVDLQRAQDAIFFIDENAAQSFIVSKYEIRYRMNARRCFEFASDLEMNTGAATWTAPRRNFSQFELRQKRRGLGRAVFEHPAHETPLMVREFSVSVAHR